MKNLVMLLVIIERIKPSTLMQVYWLGSQTGIIRSSLFKDKVKTTIWYALVLYGTKYNTQG